MNTSDGREYYGFGIDNSQLRREAQQAISILDGVGSKAEAEGARIDAAFRKAGQAVAAYFTATQLSSFVGDVVRMRGEIESLEISFETLIGNKDKAAAFFGEIKDFAVNTPMQMGDLAKGAQTMLAFNIEAEKVMPILRQIGDISMGSSDKFNSLVLAFSQMHSTGKLMGQDLLQMINAGFNPLVEISKVTGRSLSELKEDMSAGAISADMVADAFAHAAGDGGVFNGMLEKQSKGLQGSISNLQGAWDDMLNDIGSKQQGIFVSGINLATDAIKHYELFANAILSIAAAYGTYKAVLIATVAIQKGKALADNIRLVMMFRRELGLLTAAQQAFNITAWANPYVLLAAAIVGVATALYLYADNASNAEKAQEKLNNSKDDWEKHLSEEEQKVNELIGIIQDKTETDYAQLKAYEELKKVCPALTEAYTQEELASLALAEARKTLNTALEQETYENASQHLERYSWLLNEAANSEGDWTKMSKEAQNAIREELGTGLLKNKVEQLQDIVNGYQAQVDEIERIREEAEEKTKPIETKIIEAKADLEQIQKEFDKAKKKLEEEQAKVNRVFGNKIVTFWYEIKYRSAQDNLKKAQDKVSSLEAEKASLTTYQQDYDAAEKAWKDAKKRLDAIKKDKSKYTKQQYKDAADEEEKARKEFKNIGGDPLTDKQSQSASEKAKKEREEYAKKQAEYNRMVASQSEERKRAVIDAEFAVEQARIDTMQEGSEKIQAQMALDHKRELEMLDREKADYLQRKIDNAKALFEANPANKGKTFDGSNITLTPEENAGFAKRKNYTEQKQANEEQELVERQRIAMNQYLKEFGSYMEKRQAVIALYNAQMAKATTEGDRLSLAAQMERELSELDVEALKDGLDWEAVFGDLDKVSSESLHTLRTRLKEYIDTQKDLQPDSLKDLVRAIDSIDQKLNERNPFTALKASMLQVKSSTIAVDKAQEAYNKALEKGTDLEKQNAKATLDAARNAKQKALTEATDALHGSVGQVKEHVGAAEDLLGLVEQFGIDPPEWMSGYLDGLGKTLDGLESIDLTKPMSIITGGIKALSGMVEQVFSLGGIIDWNGSNAKEVQETISRLTERNELLQTAIENLTDEIKSSKGTKSVSAYRDAYKLQEETNANYKAMAQAQASYHGSHHSWNKYWGGFTQEQISRLSSQIGRAWNGDIWNLSPEEMKVLRNNVDMWERIQNTGKGGYGGRLTEKLNAYIEQAGKLEELTNQLYEGLTGMSFDSMYDSFIDTLMNMDASTKNFADGISEYFMRAMLSNKIGELYSEKLEEWWKKFGKSMEDNELTEAERNALQNEYMQYVDEAMKIRDSIAAATGYDGTASSKSQDSTKKGFATASQDSIDELNGRFLAVQLNSEEIKNCTIQISVDTKALRQEVMRTHDTVKEIREISLLSLNRLENIDKNTRELYSINERLGKIEKNTRKL